ncbi:uncharacterized protein N7484_002580 [Penicillium longicatenatum]|uniref:uncharacterized protein n=1 Tax=Penicillium longicatenatum TaxID=1561947 RepID=UPI0025488404|nr:uncharacterized protein N7484_002580 [Penicillium longicatenatum]KAJ5648857.1 hypothetical protein N7484_002580 [Penicillium longicatenatum]
MTSARSIGRKAFQGIAVGIGLVSEGISAHKAKKQNQPAQEPTEITTETELNSEEERLIHEFPTPANGTSEHPIRALEEQWALDEAQEELRHDPEEQTSSPPQYTEVDEANLAHQFAYAHPAPPPYTVNGHLPQPRLSAPVVLPQRRPKTRDRGFIRAYAPALADCGIDQTMFIEFLNTAEKACRATPWLQAINLASIGTIWLPSVTGIAVSIAIQIATDIAIAVDGRRKTNSFFDQVNKEFFQPRGLYCLIMTWNPELADAASTTVDLNSLISQAAGSGSSGTLERLRHKFKSSDGKGYGNIFPEVAPLVFPEIDQLASDPNAEKKLSKMKKKGQFVSSYMDKRAQAKFIAKNPDSHLIQGPRPTFTSRYADPNHPASSGDPLALVTGGKLSMEKLQRLKNEQLRGGRGYCNGYQNDGSMRTQSASNPAPHAPVGRSVGLRDVIAQAREFRSPQSSTQSFSRDEPYSGGRSFLARGSTTGQRDNHGLLTPIAKLMKKEVLYLAIVNMPSEDEMNRAHEAVRQMV